VIDWIRQLAPKAMSVLLSGETGTGKELVARALHDESPRRKARFVPVNCAAIPEALVESELFGHREGAFTGATAAKPGLFEAADGGTLFLDEIGELPMPMQARFLRCLENGEVRRIGETSTRHVDVRVIAATNRDLRDETSKGRFRLDLYYRVCGAHLHLPPLRERPEDIEALVRYWLPGASAWASAPVLGISPAALTTLQGHQWPGNVRELRHVFERAMFATSGPMLTVSDLREPLEAVAWGVRASHRELEPPRVPLSAGDQQLLAVLESHRWNRSEAARTLGMNRSTVWRTLRRLGLSRHPARSVAPDATKCRSSCTNRLRPGFPRIL
jgi:transcriptional regulator with PAS, ATPase and Fis domain